MTLLAGAIVSTLHYICSIAGMCTDCIITDCELLCTI